MIVHPNQRRWSLGLGVLMVLGFALAACSDSDDSMDGRARPSVEETATTTTATTMAAAPKPEEAILAGYRGFWDAYIAAADPMNPEDPRLIAHATGDELETVQKAFLARRSAGEVIRGELDLAPVVEMIAADARSATVIDCYLDRTGIYDAASGARKDTESGVRHRIRVQMVIHDGAWKVASVALKGDGCTPGA